MDSSLDNFFENTDCDKKLIFSPVLDYAMNYLKSTLIEYDKKGKENKNTVTKVGYDVNQIPLDLRKEIKNALSDSEVFRLNVFGSKEKVIVDPLHIINSFKVENEWAEMQRLKVQLSSVHTQLHHTNNNLKTNLEMERAQAEILDWKVSEKTAQTAMFKGKLETLQWELKSLIQEAEVMEKPKYTLEEIKDFHEEMTRMKAEMAIVKTKLMKYNNLPLTEKEANKQLVNLQQELAKVDNEIKKKLNNG